MAERTFDPTTGAYRWSKYPFRPVTQAKTRVPVQPGMSKRDMDLLAYKKINPRPPAHVPFSQYTRRQQLPDDAIMRIRKKALGQRSREASGELAPYLGLNLANKIRMGASGRSKPGANRHYDAGVDFFEATGRVIPSAPETLDLRPKPDERPTPETPHGQLDTGSAAPPALPMPLGPGSLAKHFGGLEKEIAKEFPLSVERWRSEMKAQEDAKQKDVEWHKGLQEYLNRPAPATDLQKQAAARAVAKVKLDAQIREDNAEARAKAEAVAQAQASAAAAAKARDDAAKDKATQESIRRAWADVHASGNRAIEAQNRRRAKDGLGPIPLVEEGETPTNWQEFRARADALPFPRSVTDRADKKANIQLKLLEERLRVQEGKGGAREIPKTLKEIIANTKAQLGSQ